MEICSKNPIFEIKNIVQSRAKYQKVMLLFDETVSSVDIREIYDAIKDFCIFNQSNILEVSKTEINNGYRLIIYYCNEDSFLKCNINTNEFVNIFIPTNKAFLPYCLSNNSLKSAAENYIIVDKNSIDFITGASFNFNLFYNYFKGLMSGDRQFWGMPISIHFSNEELVKQLDDVKDEFFFLDVDIIRKCNINYENLIIVDLILIDAFLLFLSGVKSKKLMLVDVYKSGKEDMQLIDKFYRLYNNDTFLNLVLLNYNCLYNHCLRTKQKLKEIISFLNIDIGLVNLVIEKVKSYLKNSDDIVTYLYLFNIFKV